MSYLASPFYDNIAQGRYSNIQSWSKIGFNPEIKNVTEDLIPQGGVYTFPASATKMDLVSDNDNDGKTGSPSSTGARTVTIYGLGATYNSLSETVTMNGTTPV